MADEFDPFKGSSGLMDDVDVTFANVMFGRDPGYLDSETKQPVLVMIADFVTDEETSRQIITIGKGWEAEDRGAKVVRTGTGPWKGFNNSSYLQSIINRMLELDHDTVVAHWEKTGATPQEAAYWEGLTLHMVQEDRPTFGGVHKEGEQVRTRLMPTAIVGWGDAATNGTSSAAPAKKAAAKKAPAKKAAAKKAAAPTAAADDLDKVWAAIRAIADTCETFDEYIARAVEEIPEFETNPDVAALIEDDSEDSIWGQAVAAAG